MFFQRFIQQAVVDFPGVRGATQAALKEHAYLLNLNSQAGKICRFSLMEAAPAVVMP